jgi:hypothetical protein
MAEAEKLGIVMDAKTAAAAEALNDNLTRLQASSRGMLMQGIAPLIPFLSSMSDEFVKAKKEGEGASRMSQALTTGLRLIASAALTVKTLFENIGNSIGGIAAAAVAFFGGEFARAGEILKQTRADNQANLEKLGQGLSNVWDGVAVGAEHAKTGIRGVGESTVKASDDLEKFRKVLEKVTGKESGLDSSFFSDLRVLFDGFNKGFFGKGEAGLEAYRKAVEELIKQQPIYKKQLADTLLQAKEMAKAEEALANAYDAAKKAADDNIGGILRGNQDLEFEISLIGKSTLERELAIASREKERAIMKAVSPEQREQIELLYKTREALILTRAATEGKPTYFESLRDLLGQVKDDAASISDILAGSFNGAGDAIGNMANQLARFAEIQERTAETFSTSMKKALETSDFDAMGKAMKDANDRSLKSSVSLYAGMAGAAKGFFKEHSKGYKAMEAIERTFRAMELALALESYMTKIGQLLGLTTVKATTTATNMSLETTETSSSLANSGMRAMGSTVAGVAKAFEQMGVYGFIGAAAILAFMASMGVAGGGGGGSAPKLSEERQREQGTGTVLGDSTAKSNSIANALEMLRANSDEDLSFSSAMLGSLRLIESNTKSLAAFAARSGLTGQGANVPQGGDGNSFSLSDVGIIIGRYLGGSSEHAQFGAQTLGSLINDPQGRRYTDITRTHTGSFGRTYDATNSDYDALQAELTAGIRRVAVGLRDTLAQAVNILTGGRHSVEEIQGLLDQVNIDVHRISFADLKGDDIQAAIQSVFSAIGDDMATGCSRCSTTEAWIRSRTFQHVGEGAFETIVRVANGVETRARVAGALRHSNDRLARHYRQARRRNDGNHAPEHREREGNSGVGDIIREFDGSADDLVQVYQKLLDVRVVMRAVGDDAQNLSRAMIQGAGGLTALQRGLEAYRDKFFTDGERADAASRELATTFGQLGIAMPTSNAGFRALIDSIDTSTTAGQALYGQLIALAPAFADVTDAAKDQLDQFDSIMANMRGPGYTRGLQTMQRDDALSRFMGANSWTQGMTADQVIAQLRTISREDFSSYSASNRELILSILGLTNSLDDNTDTQKQTAQRIPHTWAIRTRNRRGYSAISTRNIAT